MIQFFFKDWSDIPYMACGEDRDWATIPDMACRQDRPRREVFSTAEGQDRPRKETKLQGAAGRVWCFLGLAR